MKTLLRAVGKFEFTRDIEAAICPVGEGTVSVASIPEMKFGETLELPRNPPPLNGPPDTIASDVTMMAMINIQRLLDRLLREIDRYAPKRKRGGQFRRDYQGVIAHAANFFRQYSSVEANSSRKGKFF
jgi:hypothetical protein